MAFYFDTSALVKLVVAERETTALTEWIRTTQPVAVSSDLARTELLRAVRRGAPDRAQRAKAVLDSITLVVLRTPILDAASRLDPPTLRTLDAIHLAAALELGDDLDAMVSYDDRLIEAATAYGIAVIRPH